MMINTLEGFEFEVISSGKDQCHIIYETDKYAYKKIFSRENISNMLPITFELEAKDGLFDFVKDCIVAGIQSVTFEGDILIVKTSYNIIKEITREIRIPPSKKIDNELKEKVDQLIMALLDHKMFNTSNIDYQILHDCLQQHNPFFRDFGWPNETMESKQKINEYSDKLFGTDIHNIYTGTHLLWKELYQSRDLKAEQDFFIKFIWQFLFAINPRHIPVKLFPINNKSVHKSPHVAAAILFKGIPATVIRIIEVEYLETDHGCLSKPPKDSNHVIWLPAYDSRYGKDILLYYAVETDEESVWTRLNDKK